MQEHYARYYVKQLRGFYQEMILFSITGFLSFFSILPPVTFSIFLLIGWGIFLWKRSSPLHIVAHLKIVLGKTSQHWEKHYQKIIPTSLPPHHQEDSYDRS